MTTQVSALKKHTFDVIFGTESPAGKAFDLLLIIAILTSVAVVVADSMPALHQQFGLLFW